MPIQDVGEPGERDVADSSGEGHAGRTRGKAGPEYGLCLAAQDRPDELEELGRIELQVGRIESPLRRPRTPWDVALVSFELSRRHRFAADMASLPAHVTAHLLPTGAEPTRLITQLRYRSHSGIAGRIEVAYAASVRYLAAL